MCPTPLTSIFVLTETNGREGHWVHLLDTKDRGTVLTPILIEENVGPERVWGETETPGVEYQDVPQGNLETSRLNFTLLFVLKTVVVLSFLLWDLES